MSDPDVPTMDPALREVFFLALGCFTCRIINFLQATEIQLASHSRSLTAEDERSELSEPSTPSVQRGARAQQPTRGAHGDQLAEDPRQEPPLAATDVPPPVPRSSSPQPPSHPPLRSVTDRLSSSISYPTEEKIRTAGRGFGVFHEMWCPYDTIIAKGLEGIAADPYALSERYVILSYNYTVANTPANRERRYVAIFRDLLVFSPTVKAELARAGSNKEKIGSLLEGARGATRRSHAAAVKRSVGGWHIFSPGLSKKGPWGWYHDECGRLLCPPNIEWNDA